MTDKKLINHLKNMTQVTGKFAFLKPDKELLIWYGIAVSCDLQIETIASMYYKLVSVLWAPQAQHKQPL